MPTAIETTPEAAQAATIVETAHARLLRFLSFVPDDKLGWVSSPSARSSIRIVVHCARSSAFFTKCIGGTMPEPMPTPEEFFSDLRAGEESVTDREEAVALLEKATADLLATISTIDADGIDASPNSPFGPLPMRFWLEQAGEHLNYHVGQMAYLQTIWGNLDDHMG